MPAQMAGWGDRNSRKDLGEDDRAPPEFCASLHLVSETEAPPSPPLPPSPWLSSFPP